MVTSLALATAEHRTRRQQAAVRHINLAHPALIASYGAMILCILAAPTNLVDEKKSLRTKW